MKIQVTGLRPNAPNIKQEEMVKNTKKETAVADTKYEYFDNDLGLGAYFYKIEEETNDRIYRVIVDATGAEYFAKFANGIFGLQSYHKDEYIEWWREYDEAGEEVYYRDSTGFEQSRYYNAESNSYEVYVPNTQPIVGESWDFDKTSLEDLLAQTEDNINCMEQILQCYIDCPEGQKTQQVEEALGSVQQLWNLIKELDEYVNTPTEQ